jgi:hypothetical protein
LYLPISTFVRHSSTLVSEIMTFISNVTERTIHSIQPAILLFARVSHRRRIFLPVLGTLYILAIISYVFVWIVDPYALRSLGPTARLSERPYHDLVVPLLFSVAARDGTDLVIVGGSTSMGYTTAMLREAFPEAKRPINLSFVGPSERDFEMELARLETSKSLKRVLLTLEWSFIKDVPAFGRIWNKPPYNASWYNPVPEYGLEALRMSGQVLLTGSLDLPDWLGLSQDRPDFMVNAEPETTSPQYFAKLAQAVEISRAWVTQAPAVACDAMPNVGSILPFVRRMAARGVSVDLLFPPYSLAVYSDWSVNSPAALAHTNFPGKGAVFANLVSLRRCAVEMTSGLSNVRVHAFDAELSITGNLSLYKDTSHLLDYGTYRYILLRIGRGDAVLTKADWPRFETALKKAVEEFRP